MSMILPTDIGQYWNVPYRRNPFFTGRENILTEVHHTFFTPHPQPTHPSPVIQAITGISGIGKTQVAVEYAYRYRDSYKAVLWLNASSDEALRQSVIELSQLLHLPKQKGQDQALQDWLATHERWLLIFDSIDSSAMIDTFLLSSTASGHILCTQQRASPPHRMLELEPLTEHDGAHLLLQRAGQLAKSATFADAPVVHRTTAAKIATALGGLPLALDLAGAYIEQSESNLENYLRQYHLAAAQPQGTSGKQAIATVCALTFDEVEQINPVAADILLLCAFLAPDLIPEELFIQGAPELGPRLRPLALNALLLDAAIATLRTYGLVRRDAKAKTITMHPLLQTLLQANLNSTIRHLWMNRAVRALARIFPDPTETIDHARFQRTLLHAYACVTLIRQEALSFPEAAQLQSRYETYLQSYALL